MSNLKFRAFSKKHKIILPSLSLRTICVSPERFTEEEFDDLMIMQYTGLKDKNGKEIFEGDIVKYYKDIFEVKMNDYGRFSLFCLNNTKYNKFHGVYMFDFIGIYNEPKIEIIGNIHQNPELLKS